MQINMNDAIWGLEVLSDRSEQERWWNIDGSNGKEVSSFTEAVCGVFDDSRLSILLDAGQAHEFFQPDQIKDLKSYQR